MSYLKKYRRESMQTLTRQYATKLPEDLADQFEEWCRELNITPSEALRYLVYEEIQRLKAERERLSYQTETKDTNSYLRMTDDTFSYLAVSSVTDQKPRASEQKPKSSGGKRFETTRWQIGGKTACPICQTWQSSGNFSRHAKQHGMTTQEIFTNPEYIAIADQMVQEAQENRENRDDSSIP